MCTMEGLYTPWYTPYLHTYRPGVTPLRKRKVCLVDVFIHPLIHRRTSYVHPYYSLSTGYTCSTPIVQPSKSRKPWGCMGDVPGYLHKKGLGTSYLHLPNRGCNQPKSLFSWWKVEICEYFHHLVHLHYISGTPLLHLGYISVTPEP